jgi:hypothetical protein
MLVKHEQLTEQIIKGFYTVHPCLSVSYFSPLAAPVSGASQARAPVQVRPRGRGLGAFQRPRLAPRSQPPSRGRHRQELPCKSAPGDGG